MQAPSSRYRIDIVILLFLTLLFLALAGLLANNAWHVITTFTQIHAMQRTTCSEDEDGTSCSFSYQIDDRYLNPGVWPDLFGDPEHVTIFSDPQHPWETPTSLIGLWIGPDFCLLAALFCLALLIGKVHINRLVRRTEAEMAEVTVLKE
ncbi:MAG TPA: hypothetical protein VFN35_21665 [Ktedonobacteraceae bacterium]|nr:hypothetical protein [Ktedonobacteraceae bacterium]